MSHLLSVTDSQFPNMAYYLWILLLKLILFAFWGVVWQNIYIYIYWSWRRHCATLGQHSQPRGNQLPMTPPVPVNISILIDDSNNLRESCLATASTYKCRRGLASLSATYNMTAVTNRRTDWTDMLTDFTSNHHWLSSLLFIYQSIPTVAYKCQTLQKWFHAIFPFQSEMSDFGKKEWSTPLHFHSFSLKPPDSV
jgi:hypothetical protein